MTIDMKKRLVFLGAGASYGARKPQPPLGEQLIGYLLRVLDETPADVMEELVSSCIEAGEFDPIQELRNFLEKHESQPYESAVNGLLSEAYDLHPYGWKLLNCLNRLIAFGMRGDGLPEWLAGAVGPALPPMEFEAGEDLYDDLVDLLSADTNVAVISLNYDLLFEQALARKGREFCYSSINFGWHGEAVASQSPLIVYKPHGSINWFPNDGNHCSYDGTEPTPSEVEIRRNAGTWLSSSNYEFSTSVESVGEGLFSSGPRYDPIMAHFCAEKPVASNLSTLSRVRERCLEVLDEVSAAWIIGVRPVNAKDDAIVDGVFQRLRRLGPQVEFINPNPENCSTARELGFRVFQIGFRDWLNGEAPSNSIAGRDSTSSGDG